MSKSANHRKSVQNLTCRAVLSKYLEGKALEDCLMDLRAAMRQGPQAWAFKPQDEEVADDRVYYNNQHENK